MLQHMINYPLEARVWARTGHARRARRAGHVRHGKVHTATRGSAVWTYAYYNRGQPKSVTLASDGHSFTLTHGYNASGHENSLTYPSGLTVSYAPDGLGRPTQAGTYASDARNAPNGRLSDVTYGNGVSWHATYNTRQLPRTWRYRWAFSTYSYRVLDYDANANPTSILEDGIFDGGDRPRYAPGLDSGTFTYDALDRLTGADYVVRGPLAYAYDPLGNVREYTHDGNTASYAYDATNREAGNTYDARGNPTGVGGAALTWNLANELVEDLYGTTYAYDARGWRVKQEVTAQHTDDGVPHTRYFVYDAAHRLVERWDNGTVTDFVSLGDKAVARIKGGTTTYIHGDYQDTPLLETDANGAITRTPQIYAYNLTGAAGVEEIPGYTGAAADKETGLLYLGARYLHGPRFLSPDPAGLDPTTPFGLNRYAYANDNPVRYTDPFGMCAQDKSESDEPCPQPTEPPPPPPPPKQPTQLPPITVTATTIALPRPVFEPTPFPWGRLAGGLLRLGSRTLGPVIGIAWPTTMDAPACELPGHGPCGLMMSEMPPGYWPADKGAEEWGRRHGIGASAGRRQFHRKFKQGDTVHSGGESGWSVNPDTGDVKDPDGESHGQLQE